MDTYPEIQFTMQDAENANKTWGLNCGPGAVAAILGKTLDEVRPHVGAFESKGYTNPTLMFEILNNCGAKWRKGSRFSLPRYGLARIQWHGPWTQPGVPARVAYRHTHWIGSRVGFSGSEVFDVNCMSVGGWISYSEWSNDVVPWLLSQCEPKANGRWDLTHAVEIEL